MAQFAELLETAIANADSRDQLTASRARLLTAADDARRRVVRDLHDGAQQRLVHTDHHAEARAAERSRDDDGRGGAARGRGARRTPSRATRSCASSPTASCRPPSRAAGCGPASTRVVARLDLPVRRRRPGRAVPGRDRGERLLHRGRGADERGQARAREARRGPRVRRRTAGCASRCATTASAAPIRAGTASWASPTASTALGGRLRGPGGRRRRDAGRRRLDAASSPTRSRR